MLSLPKHLYRVFLLDAQWRGFDKLSLLMVGIWLSLPASAQNHLTPRVYTYVEQMPQLPGGGGMAAVVAEVWKHLHIPTLSVNDDFSGRAQLYFEVSTRGQAQHARIVHSTRSPKVDSALVAAIRALPTFTPGRQHGRPVTVSFTLPISCIKPQF
jgi:TonB family protein